MSITPLVDVLHWAEPENSGSDGEKKDVINGVISKITELIDRQPASMPWADFQKTGWMSDVKDDVSISFDDGNMRLSVVFTGTVSYWINGVEYTKTGTETVDITDTEGMWYAYYLGSTLTVSQSIWDILDTDKVMVCYIYWDATANTYRGLGWEFHGWKMDSSTHHHFHEGFGTLYIDGLTATISTDFINLTAGEIEDEDIELNITDGAGSGLFEQDLTPIDAPILYLDTSNNLRGYASSTAPVALANDNVLWNDNGAPTEAGLSKYTAMWLIASNEINKPVFWIMGNGIPANTSSAAVLANPIDGINWGALPYLEFKVLFRLIVKNVSLSPYYELDSLDDFRSSTPVGGVYTPTDHGTLGGLADDDHPQYAEIANIETISAIWTYSAQVNFAGGTTYKIESDGDAFFKDVDASGNLVVDGDASFGGTDFNAFSGIGSDNSEWIPINLIGTNNNSEPHGWRISNGYWSNVLAIDHNVLFQLDLPTNRDGLKLYVDGIRLVIQDADGSNQIDTTTLRGINTSSWDPLHDDPTNRTSSVDITFTAVDCSSYDKILLQFAMLLDTQNAFDFYPMLRCYYDI